MSWDYDADTGWLTGMWFGRLAVCLAGWSAGHSPQVGHRVSLAPWPRRARIDRPDWPTGQAGVRATIRTSLEGCGNAVQSLSPESLLDTAQTAAGIS